MPGEREFHTKAGLLTGVINERVDNSGNLRSCMLCKQNKIFFQEDILIPKYESEDFRTRYRDAVTFYKSGELKSVYLEHQQEIHSPLGRIKAELVTFYKSGSLLRVFPVYGQISGYWSENEEAEMLLPYVIETGGQKLTAKISGICFYESGAVKSITLFPGESVTINTPLGEARVHYGISFYESGSIESVEPDIPTAIIYGSCKFLSKDNHPIGVHGDKNSLSFYEDGSLKALTTTITAVIFSRENEKLFIMPERKISPTDIDETEIVPIKIDFQVKNIRVTDSNGLLYHFNTEQYEMKTVQILENLSAAQSCTDCNSCSNCGRTKQDN